MNKIKLAFIVACWLIVNQMDYADTQLTKNATQIAQVQP